MNVFVVMKSNSTGFFPVAVFKTIDAARKFCSEQRANLKEFRLSYHICEYKDE